MKNANKFIILIVLIVVYRTVRVRVVYRIAYLDYIQPNLFNYKMLISMITDTKRKRDHSDNGKDRFGVDNLKGLALIPADKKRRVAVLKEVLVGCRID